MSLYGHMLCFLNCHLAAHMNYATERVDEFEYIMDMQTYDCKKAPTILDHRLVKALTGFNADLHFPHCTCMFFFMYDICAVPN